MCTMHTHTYLISVLYVSYICLIYVCAPYTHNMQYTYNMQDTCLITYFLRIWILRASLGPTHDTCIVFYGWIQRKIQGSTLGFLVQISGFPQ